MSTTASSLLLRLQVAYRRAGSPPLHDWGFWPGARSDGSAVRELAEAGMLVEHRGAWALTPRALATAPPQAAWDGAVTR